MFNRNEGVKRDAALPPFWPAASAAPEEAMCGVVVEHSHYNAGGDRVASVLFTDVIARVYLGEGKWQLRKVGDVTVSVSALLRAALAPHKTPAGTAMQIVFVGQDEAIKAGQSGMKKFEVSVVSGEYLLSLHEQAALDARA